MVIAVPPLLAGATNATDALPMPDAVAMTAVGWPGGADGVDEFEGEDAALVPDKLVAVTVKV